MNPVINEEWKGILKKEFNSNYFLELKQFLLKEKFSNTVFPPSKFIFNAFNSTPFSEVKVVLLGQDPYHSFEVINNVSIPHAHGLCFSIPREAKKIPPSLQNIYKEIHNDLGLPIANHGDLSTWAKQGVLMLNATLTVRKHEAGSHQKKGWEQFTDAAIQQLSEQKEGLVFLLWGRFAQNKESLIDSNKHFILKAAHPSPFSAHNGFFGCQHFSKTNEILKRKGLKEIDWEIK
ncbi:MAG: uracil-DNA glycosylase [Vicingus serpentipes]|nr:uracil-DNA glycosylase [Vicingus serpentipes]